MHSRGWAGAALAALALALTLALTACGGGGDDRERVASLDGRGRQASGAPTDERKAMLAFARCMREHGVELPDPQAGEGGAVIRPGAGPSSADAGEFQEAEKQCRKHLENVRPPELSEEQEEAMREASLKHARCMRAHGIDIPDPTFGEEGGIARIPLDRVDFDDPDFQAAQKACEKHLRQLPGVPGVEFSGP